MPTDKEGNKLTWKEYVERWKKGIKEITPLQQLTTQINSTYIILIGLVSGLVITIYNFKQFWWLAIILFGALINTYIQLIGLKQKRNLFETIEKGGIIK